jgi:hypothetical protein
MTDRCACLLAVCHSLLVLLSPLMTDALAACLFAVCHSLLVLLSPLMTDAAACSRVL